MKTYTVTITCEVTDRRAVVRAAREIVGPGERITMREAVLLLVDPGSRIDGIKVIESTSEEDQ